MHIDRNHVYKLIRGGPIFSVSTVVTLVETGPFAPVHIGHMHRIVNLCKQSGAKAPPPPFAPVQLRTSAKGGTTWPSVERPAGDRLCRGRVLVPFPASAESAAAGNCTKMLPR
jgi:hypothetical protein